MSKTQQDKKIASLRLIIKALRRERGKLKRQLAASEQSRLEGLERLRLPEEREPGA
jgi:hypothetical protein